MPLRFCGQRRAFNHNRPLFVYMSTTSQATDFKKLLSEHFSGTPHEGDVVEGVVLSISKAEVRIEIGGVMVGIARGKELLGMEEEELKIGDTVEATVIEEENENGEVELSFRTAGFIRGWEKAAAAQNSNESVEITIVDANKGGLMVTFGPIKGFLPVSQLSPENYPRVPGGDKAKILEHLRSFAKRKLKVKVIDVNPRDEKLIVSEKAVWEEEQKHVLDKYSVADIIEGKISALTSFGAFVEFGEGLEGLVHISEIAWQRIDHPKDVLAQGQEVKAQIIQIDGSKIFLSMKRLSDDPWKTVKEKYAVGDVVKGKVIKINPFGLFVELDNQIHGLAHISELSDKPVEDISTIASIGSELEFEIVSIEPAAHRLGLRIAGVKPRAPKSEEKKEEKAEEKKDEPEGVAEAAEQKVEEVSDEVVDQPIDN